MLTYRYLSLSLFPYHVIYLLDNSVTRANLAHTYETGGILDMKWSDSGILGQCNWDGHLSLYTYDAEARAVSETDQLKLADDIVLSMDWNDLARRGGSADSSTTDSGTGKLQCIVSHRDKALTLVDVSNQGGEVVQSWPAHDFEPWICAFDYWDRDVVYSGGDDCVFMAWDTRTDCSMPMFKNRAHTMGVCSLQSNPNVEHSLISGSYDETLRFWDTRSMRRPLGEVVVGGGLWRLKWHPTISDLILTASMHNNFHICKTSREEQDTSTEDSPALASGGESIAMYTGHEGDLSYGVDWCRCHNCLNNSTLSHAQARGEDDTSSSWAAICGSCCFVTDNAVQVWSVNPV
eukprot:TRINITY_DN3176_c0_g1_i1.p1 TRINITY_DN3176_c0_g1~~TRINITY_DN3176_c0_g1_i1.p1  ORF type:complete len:348 (+),score=34.53 TRINITY_DN3176_c0_g1_i1:322-1365(+)